jgi:hypothetical protein
MSEYVKPAGVVNVNYRGDVIDPATRLVECSDCHCAVPWDSFQSHIAWHARIMYAPSEMQAAARQR